MSVGRNPTRIREAYVTKRHFIFEWLSLSRH